MKSYFIASGKLIIEVPEPDGTDSVITDFETNAIIKADYSGGGGYKITKEDLNLITRSLIAAAHNELGVEFDLKHLIITNISHLGNMTEEEYDGKDKPRKVH